MANKTKKCIFCEKRIDIESTKCPHCGQSQAGNKYYLIALGGLLAFHLIVNLLGGNGFSFSRMNPFFNSFTGKNFSNNRGGNWFSDFLDERESRKQQKELSLMMESSEDSLAFLQEGMELAEDWLGNSDQMFSPGLTDSEWEEDEDIGFFDELPPIEEIIYGYYDFSPFGPIPDKAPVPQKTNLDEILINTLLISVFDRDSPELFWFSQMLRNSPALKDEFISYIVGEESNGEYTNLEPFYIELQPVIDENGMDFVVDKLLSQLAGNEKGRLPVWWYTQTPSDYSMFRVSDSGDSAGSDNLSPEEKQAPIPGDKGLAVYDPVSESFSPLKKNKLIPTNNGWEWGIARIENAGQRLKSNQKDIPDKKTGGYFLKISMPIKNVSGIEYAANYGTPPTLILSPYTDLMDTGMIGALVYGQAYLSRGEIGIGVSIEKSRLKNNKTGEFVCLYEIPQELASLKRLYAVNGLSVIGFDTPVK